MLKVTLVSMPYAVLTMPSLGIAQLQAVVHMKLGERARVEPAHCYLDFAEFVGGPDKYKTLGLYIEKGLCEWLFRAAAFDAEDNLEAYREFFFSDGASARKRKTFELALERREHIGAFLDGLIERYRLYESDIVGFTSMMSQNVPSFALARRLKAQCPRVITVLGGPNADYPMGKAIAENVSHIDYVFSGEGLVSFPHFIAAVLERNEDGMSSIRGVRSRSHGQLSKNTHGNSSTTPNACVPQTSPPLFEEGKQKVEREAAERPAMSGEVFDLNEMPLLDYSAYLARIKECSYYEELKPHLILSFQTSSGCWKADGKPCSFCSYALSSSRMMTPATAKTYINALIDKYQEEFTIFEAADLNMPLGYFKEVLPYVNQDKTVILQYEVTSRLKAADVAEMAKANVILPQPGIESLSTKTLKLMRKGVTAFRNVQFLKRCVENGLYPIWNYLCCFPNTDYDELEKGDKLVGDIKSVYHLPPPAAVVPISYFRFSEYVNRCAEYKLDLRPSRAYAQIFPFEAQVIEDLAYLFCDEGPVQTAFEEHGDALQRMRLEIATWMFRFRERVPKLCFVDQCIIEDTRGEKPARYRVRAIDAAILRYLNEPHFVDDVAAHFNLKEKEIERVIRQLKNARLLFSEGERHMSVVCESCLLNAADYNRYYVNFVRSGSAQFE